jgi:hypothetical protein
VAVDAHADADDGGEECELCQQLLARIDGDVSK